MRSEFTPDPRTYTKRNFVELIELITPEVYQEEDLALSGREINPASRIINTHLAAANDISQVLSISAVANSQTSSLDNISGISQYFVKQNKLTNVTPYSFETKILLPLGSTFKDFATSGEYNTYLSGTLLPQIILATGSEPGALHQNISTLSALTTDNNPSSVHNYLVDTLGWMYFLNTSADGGLTYNPSSFVLESLNTLYLGNSLNTVDGIKGFDTYLWKNYSTCTTFSNLSLIPADFVSGSADTILTPSAGVVATWTSGTQKLDNLLTWLDVIYSPAYMDQQDFKVQQAFNDYIDATISLTDLVSKGPFRKFIDAFGFQAADITEQIESIGLLYDIENCPEEYLQFIADLIGWKLYGASTSKWRHQLRTAVDLYKRKGTLDSIQYALNTLVTNSVLDVSGRVAELWESYIPFLIWYSLGTESPYFRDLTTWTQGLATDAGVYYYNPSSIEENLKIVTDSIILDLYKKFPDNFLYNGEKFPVNRMYTLDDRGCPSSVYTIINEPHMKPFHMHTIDSPGYGAFKREALILGKGDAWNAAHCDGPLGTGVYMAGLEHPQGDEEPIYLSATGDLEFLFNYRTYTNHPLPPFEQIKYYRDSSLTPALAAYLKEKLACFAVRREFCTDVEDFILSAGINTDTNLGSLNEFLMFFSAVQTPPNYDDVLYNISESHNNLLSLWNGKSSHIFIDFDNTDFDFAKTTLDGDSKYALYEASRVATNFSPAHTIARINLNASAMDYADYSSTRWSYIGFDQDDTRVSYTSASVLAGFEWSGLDMGAILTAGGGDSNLDGDAGRGGLNTFKRADVDNIVADPLFTKKIPIVDDVGTVSRTALRRRNFRYTLPTEGYYHRTGFNAPNSWDPSTLEYSMPSSVGEFTLGYVASAGKFFPIVDPINPSGVWDKCEDLTSPRSFSAIYTSATFPYRGLRVLGSNAKWDEVEVSTARYVDRGQTPHIYIVMHELLEEKARDLARTVSSITADTYWKNEIQSYANSAIASGYVFNSDTEYRNFSFGIGLQKLYKDYAYYFQRHYLSRNDMDDTGGSIFGQVFGDGLYNDNFSVEGYAVETTAGDYVASSFASGLAINQNAGSGIFSTCAVAAYSDGSNDLPASGTYIASATGDLVVPLSGTQFIQEAVYNAEFRNPHILSGVEFCDTSGSPSENAFYVFKADSSFKVPGAENYLIDNTVIKCKTAGGFPRLRFDLSAYGKRRNYFIKDHKFKLKIKALVAEENSPILGGGQLGVWIHTNPIYDASAPSGVMWSWTPEGKWALHNATNISLPTVLGSYAHIHTYDLKTTESTEEETIYCLGNTSESTQESVINNVSLNNILEGYFETYELNFDTRNYTNYNNYEYLKIIPVPEEYYRFEQTVNRDDANYYVEIFFLPPTNPGKYLLIDSISLEDSTQRDNAGLGTDHGIQTSGIPLRKFVKEDKLYLNKEQLRTVLKFFTGLAGKGYGLYKTSLASRDFRIGPNANDIYGILYGNDLGPSGGSRLNYRIHPLWGDGSTKRGNNSFENVVVDN